MVGGLGPKPNTKAVVLLWPLQLRAPGTRLKSEIGWAGEEGGEVVW